MNILPLRVSYRDNGSIEIQRADYVPIAVMVCIALLIVL